LSTDDTEFEGQSGGELPEQGDLPELPELPVDGEPTPAEEAAVECPFGMLSEPTWYETWKKCGCKYLTTSMALAESGILVDRFKLTRLAKREQWEERYRWEQQSASKLRLISLNRRIAHMAQRSKRTRVDRLNEFQAIIEELLKAYKQMATDIANKAMTVQFYVSDVERLFKLHEEVDDRLEGERSTASAGAGEGGVIGDLTVNPPRVIEGGRSGRPRRTE